MSTPIVDVAMPVSFTLVRQAGSDQLMRADGGEHHRLEGPSVVAASWSGPQKAEIWHQHKTSAGWGWRKLAEFNGGGEPLSESGQKPANQSWCTSVLQRLHRMWPRTTEEHSPSTRSTSRSAPRRGGGVNGRRSAGNHHLFDGLQWVIGVLPGSWRVLAPLQGGGADNLGYGARRHRVSTPVLHGGVQNEVPHQETGGRANRCTPERRPTGGGGQVPVVLLRYRQGGLLGNDHQVLATSAAGGGCGK